MNFKNLWTSVVLLVIMTVITGLIYPLLITGIAQLVISGGSEWKPHCAGWQGRWIRIDRTTIHRTAVLPRTPLIDGTIPVQRDSLPPARISDHLTRHFWIPYSDRACEFRSADSTATRPIPVDLVTASASGLDPHISVMAAFVQIARVARARGMSEGLIDGIVDQRIEGRQFGVLGEPRVNVLLVNLDLDRISPKPEKK